MTISITKLYEILNKKANQLKQLEDERFKLILKKFREICKVGSEIESQWTKSGAEGKAAEVRKLVDTLLDVHIGKIEDRGKTLYKFDNEELIKLAEAYIHALELLQQGKCKYTKAFVTVSTPDEDLAEINWKLPILRESVTYWRAQLQLSEEKPREIEAKAISDDTKGRGKTQDDPHFAYKLLTLLPTINQKFHDGSKYHGQRLHYLYVMMFAVKARSQQELVEILENQINKEQVPSGGCFYWAAAFVHRCKWTIFGQYQLDTDWCARGDDDNFKQQLTEIKNIISSPAV